MGSGPPPVPLCHWTPGVGVRGAPTGAGGHWDAGWGEGTTGITNAVTPGTAQGKPPPPDQDPLGLPTPCLWDGSTDPQNSRPPPHPQLLNTPGPILCPRPHLGLLPLSSEELPALGGGLRWGLPHSGPPRVGVRVRVRCPPRRLLHPLRPPRPSAHVGVAPRAPPPRSYWLLHGGGGAGGHTPSPRSAIGWGGGGAVGVLGCRGAPLR